MTPQYHDALDRFEAKQRAEQFEREQAEKDEPKCVCFEYMGDNPECPLHGKLYKQPKPEPQEPEFGSAAWFASIEPIEF